MELMLNGYMLPVSHMGPDFLRLRNATEHEAAEAEVVMVVDGHETRWRVWLPEGLRAGKGRVRLERILRKE